MVSGGCVCAGVNGKMPRGKSNFLFLLAGRERQINNFGFIAFQRNQQEAVMESGEIPTFGNSRKCLTITKYRGWQVPVGCPRCEEG